MNYNICVCFRRFYLKKNKTKKKNCICCLTAPVHS